MCFGPLKKFHSSEQNKNRFLVKIHLHLPLV
uniref:Uncharacterized protein n=1 Tax=virus sp. ct8MV80 TaxID=2826793 RepID=A0A8S5R813_9VIRU|nr:MAG TPA: hypothetical protein [virus sp. ct8MV80]